MKFIVSFGRPPYEKAFPNLKAAEALVKAKELAAQSKREIKIVGPSGDEIDVRSLEFLAKGR